MSSSVVISTSQNCIRSRHATAGLRLAPELDAVVEVHAGLHAGGAGGLQRFARRLGGGRTQRRRDAGDVEPLDAGKHLGPRHHARTDRGDGRALAIVKHTAGAGAAPNSRK